MSDAVICLVTIHGIGFQQPPQVGENGAPDIPGYADGLHEHLSKILDESWLCDDPERTRSQHGQNGPVYVQSVWPPGSRCREAGLRRLGSWDDSRMSTVIGPDTRLCDGKGRITHVALVYSQLEEQGPQLGAALIAGAMTMGSLGHYTTVTNLVQSALLDTEPLWQHLLHPQGHDNNNSTAASSSLRVRQDPGFKPRHPAVVAQTNGAYSPTGLLKVLRTLENDVAAYVCLNEMRERVRSFVLDALLRLACREDVSGIVLNAHSNGTVIALDVLRELPPFAAKKILALVTAGSPLRKYCDFFTWGPHLATVPKIERWLNFLDSRDPVADVLEPCADWIRGTPVKPEMLTGLYRALDPNTGEISNINIKDCVVDNLANSQGGGLQAHNYWDNETEFVTELAKLLMQVTPQNQPVTG